MSNTRFHFSFIAVAFICIIVFLNFSCGNSEKNVYKQDTSKVYKGSAIDSAYLNAPFFGPEHGKIEYESTSSGLKQKKTLYWVDFGRSIALVGETNLKNTVMQSRKIVTPEYSFDIDFSNRQASKLPIIFDPAERVNYLALNQAVMDELKITKGGTELILNNTCTVYKMDLPIIQSTSLIFKGMTLKSEYVLRGMKSSLIATRIDTVMVPDPSIFEVPEGYKIIDLTTP